MIPSDKSSITNLFQDITVGNIKLMDFWNSWQLTNEFKNYISGEGTVLTEEGDDWHSLSEQIYGIRDYWWVLALYNDIEDPFSLFFQSNVPLATKRIKVIRPDEIDKLVDEVRRIRIQKEKDNA